MTCGHWYMEPGTEAIAWYIEPGTEMARWYVEPGTRPTAEGQEVPPAACAILGMGKGRTT